MTDPHAMTIAEAGATLAARRASGNFAPMVCTITLATGDDVTGMLESVDATATQIRLDDTVYASDVVAGIRIS